MPRECAIEEEFVQLYRFRSSLNYSNKMLMHYHDFSYTGN